MSAPLSVNQVVTGWLGSRIEPRKPEKSVVLAFVSRLLEIFGLEYASKIQGLEKKTETEFDHLNSAYCEIQRNFQRGITVRTDTDEWKKTTFILRRYRIDGRSDDQFFEILAKGSYKILPFPQKVVVYKHPLPKSVKIIDEIREKVLRQGNLPPEFLQKIDEAREKLILYKHGDSGRLLRNIQEELLTQKEPDSGLLAKIEEAINAHRIYENPQLEALKKIEEERVYAFNRILGRLQIKHPAVVEEKGALPLVPVKQKEWTAEEEQSIAEHYYKWPVLIFNGRKVYLWELVETWKYLRDGAAKADSLLFGPMDLRKWLVEGEPKLNPIIEFTNIKADSIGEFIVECSLLAIQKNLEVEFSPSLRATLAQEFRDDESKRLDWCYFTSDMRFFYGLDFGKINRSSTRGLLSAQIYYFIVRTTGLKKEKRSDVFEMILHRNGRWKLDSLVAFPHRDWNYKRPLDEEREFRLALREIGALLNLLPNVQNLYKDPYCWPLFFFLWKNPPSAGLFGAFELLIKKRHMTLDLEVLFKFFTKHGVEWPNELIQYFLEFHLRVADELERGGIKTEHGECLMLDPPIDRFFANISLIGLIQQNTQKFLHLMRPYNFPPDKRYMRMLRPFINKPNELMFKLLRDCRELGIERPSEDLITEALSKDHEGIEGAESARTVALQIANKLQQRFKFSDVNIFFLYLEIIRLVKAGKEQNVISRINAVVIALEKFCPELKKEIVHFLFLYHPEVSSYFIDALENMRLEWGQSKHLSRFILPQDEFSQIRRPIDAFVEGLAQACKDENTKDIFMAYLSDAMRAAFFPPRQAIGDACKISNIVQTKVIWKDRVLSTFEVIWKDRTWSTHLGTITFLLKNADIGVHFHWEICDGYPVFVMSFYDFQKKRGFSGAVRLDVPAEDLIEEPKRKGFYMYLYTMSLKVLDEDLKESPPEGSEETPEILLPYYETLEDALNNIFEIPGIERLTNEEISALWQFFKKVKETYRKLFYSSTANRPPPHIKVDAHPEVAALGRIFPSHPRGALLPGSHLLLSDNPESYLPDAPEESMEELARILAHPTTSFQSLNLDLHIEGKKLLPIFYLTRTTSDLAKQNVESMRARDWDEKAAPLNSVLGARYVTLGVELEGQLVHFTVQYPQYPKQCFRESNGVLLRNLARRLSQQEANILERFEEENVELTNAYDDQSIEHLYKKLLLALKKEVPNLVAELIVVYDEESTKVIYEKLLIDLEKKNPKLLQVFKEENQKILDEANDGEFVYGRLLEMLRKENPKFIEEFENENIRLLDSLRKVNPEFLKAFNEEEAKLLSAYREQGVKRFQSFFDIHNLWLKGRVYDALCRTKRNLSKENSEESLEILEDIGSYQPRRGQEEEKRDS